MNGFKTVFNKKTYQSKQQFYNDSAVSYQLLISLYCHNCSVIKW